MSHSQSRLGVGILVPLLALVASACANPPPPKAALEYEQKVKPGLVLVETALNEQGFDTAVIDSQLSAGSHSFKIETAGDGDPWTDRHARAAISGAADSLSVAGFDCNRYPSRPSAICYTEFWYIDVQHSPDLFNWGLFVSVSGRCWEEPKPYYCQ